MTERSDLLRQIRDELIAATDAPLYAYRTANNYYPVAGMGNHYAKIMFVGEAPGENEAKQGRPFVGAAGKFLDELLNSIQLKREDVYITNIVKDRPPDNRDPSREEIAYYAPFLIRQINIIQPQVIATLGRFSMTWLLTRYNSPHQSKKISELHGKVVPLDVDYGQISLVALYHPAQALYKAADRPIHLADFKALEAFK